MRNSRDDARRRDPVSDLLSREEATKDNPYQPPWIEKVRDGIGILVTGLLLIAIYPLVSLFGDWFPGAAHRANAYLNDVDTSRKQYDAMSRAGVVSTNPASANAQLVYASALSGAPGAIICKDYQALSTVFQLYNQNFEQRLQDAVTKGLSTTIRGPAAPEPDPTLYGCLVAPEDTPMQRELGGAVPVVTVKFSDGTFFQGVTLPQMAKIRPSK